MKYLICVIQSAVGCSVPLMKYTLRKERNAFSKNIKRPVVGTTGRVEKEKLQGREA